MQRAKANHEALHEKADDLPKHAMAHAKQQEDLGKLTVSAAESSTAAQKRCIDDFTSTLEEEHKRHRSEQETAEKTEEWYKGALTHRIALTEECQSVMAKQDALLKQKESEGGSLETWVSESLDTELANLYNKVDEQGAAMAEQVAKTRLCRMSCRGRSI